MADSYGAFALRGARGEGGRRPDEGCGHLRRSSEPLTPALSPHPMKGEGEWPTAVVAKVAQDFSNGSGGFPSPSGRGQG